MVNTALVDAGFPSQGAAGAGTPGATPGMPQSAGGAGGLGNGAQQGGADPNSAAGQGPQGQWPSDPSSYYSNYWGGYYGQQPAGQQGAPDVQMSQN